MKKTFLASCATCISLAAAGFAMNIGVAVAKETGDQAEEIVVVGAPIQRNRKVERGTYGNDVEVIELMRQVSYADLDLTKYADVKEIESRIEATARESCEQLSEMFRLDMPKKEEVANCTKTAVMEAKEKLRVAIAAAN